MNDLKIIVTACGCPGGSTLIRMLKNNGERRVVIVGTDMDNEAIGGFLTDKFYRVPPGWSKEYVPHMLDLVEKEKPDVLFPESSLEVYPLACNKSKFEELGVKVIVSDPESIRISSNKFLMYETLREKSRISLPKYYSAESYPEFMDVLYRLNYPQNPVVFKPHVGKGSRGVRIIDPNIDRLKHLMEEKPISKYISLEEFKSIFRDSEFFPPLVVMEFLDEPMKGQCTSDTLCMEGRELLTTIKTVERARWGVIQIGELVDKPDLIEQTKEILKAIPLSYCVNIQFIADKLIEINPRVSTFIFQRDLIAPYLAVKLALGELSEEDVISYRSKIDYGRRMVRYMDQIFHRGGMRIL
jgi:carbamoyl-phosphate synthase large subunit